MCERQGQAREDWDWGRPTGGPTVGPRHPGQQGRGSQRGGTAGQAREVFRDWGWPTGGPTVGPKHPGQQGRGSAGSTTCQAREDKNWGWPTGGPTEGPRHPGQHGRGSAGGTTAQARRGLVWGWPTGVSKQVVGRVHNRWARKGGEELFVEHDCI